MEVVEIFEEYDKDHPLQGQQEHHCTDCFCCFLFLCGILGLPSTQYYAFSKGNFGIFTHFWDYRGAMCGMGFGPNGTDDVLTKPYLYFCNSLDHEGRAINGTNCSNWQGIDWVKPICVERCPELSPKQDKGAPVEYCPEEGSNLHGFNKYAYPARNGDTMLRAQDNIDTAEEPFIYMCINGGIDGSVRSYLEVDKLLIPGLWLLLPTTLVAVLVGVAYLLLLGSCALTLVRLGVFNAVMTPILLGIFFCYLKFFVCGCIFLALGLVIARHFCKAMADLETAVVCVEVACECIYQDRSLFLAPCFSLITRAVTFWAIFPAFAYMTATGTPRATPFWDPDTWIFQVLGLSQKLKAILHGCHKVEIFTAWTYSSQDWALLFYLCFMKVWLMETTRAMSQYAVAHATQLWYFTPYDGDEKKRLSSHGILHGYASVLRYHMGSVSLGALLMYYLKSLKTLFGMLTSSMKSQSNCVARCMAHCCCFVMAFFDGFLQFLNVSAYMDIAVSSDKFFVAAPRATQVMAEASDEVALLQGADSLFITAGMVLTSIIPTIFMLFLAAACFGRQDFDVRMKVVWTLVLLSFILSLLVGSSIMFLIDSVAGTVLYCYAIDEKYQARTAATVMPLNDTLGRDDTESVTYEDTFFEWLFGTSQEVRVEPKATVTATPVDLTHHTPLRIRQLIEEHKTASQFIEGFSDAQDSFTSRVGDFAGQLADAQHAQQQWHSRHDRSTIGVMARGLGAAMQHA